MTLLVVRCFGCRLVVRRRPFSCPCQCCLVARCGEMAVPLILHLARGKVVLLAGPALEMCFGSTLLKPKAVCRVRSQT